MRPKVSVAMATYNGEKYIREQIKTILDCLEENDELVISDDGSTDNTLGIINSFNDNRIVLIDGPKKGIKQNFANAIKNTSGEYIFLSDQDDIWKKDKVTEVLKCFEEEKCTLVVHDAEVVDENLNMVMSSYYSYRNSGKGIIKNIYKNTYIGCCMAFLSKAKKYVLPIPNDIEMHDQWIGVLNDKYGKTYFSTKKLIKYRRHSLNNSQMNHYGIIKMIKNRLTFIVRYMERIYEKR
ncbi:MAG: glycosyltransferase family 2 protein [Clostridia bacterium]